MGRTRLTITIDSKVISQVDQQVDGVRIRNRSHAIEYLLSRSMMEKPKKAVILAGGKGIKMRPFTYETPKVLLPIHSRPILEHTIDLLRKNDIRDIVISLGHLGEKVSNYFGDGSKFGVKISYKDQGENLKGTGGATKITKDLVGKNTFIVIYGDVLVNIDLAEFFEFHQAQKKLGTIALTSAKNTSLYGVVNLRGGEILDFSEKPRLESSSHLISAGIYIFEPEIFDFFPKESQFSLEKDVFPKLAGERKLAGWVFEGPWFDVGTPETFERAVKEWKEQ